MEDFSQSRMLQCQVNMELSVCDYMWFCRYIYSVEYTTDSQQRSTETDCLWKTVQEEVDKNKEKGLF